jgi:hypothetical protein
MEGEVVGRLHIQIAGEDQSSRLKEDVRARFLRLTYADTQSGSIEVCGNEQFYLGRDPEFW